MSNTHPKPPPLSPLSDILSLGICGTSVGVFHTGSLENAYRTFLTFSEVLHPSLPPTQALPKALAYLCKTSPSHGPADYARYWEAPSIRGSPAASTNLETCLRWHQSAKGKA